MEGKLGHKKFDFTSWNDGKAYKCGYSGCAIGECPIVFPKAWHFDAESDPVLKGNHSPSASGEDFFGISCNEFWHLFSHGAQDIAEYGGMPLSERATPRQVAMNILCFIEVKRKQMREEAVANG